MSKIALHPLQQPRGGKSYCGPSVFAVRDYIGRDMGDDPVNDTIG